MLLSRRSHTEAAAVQQYCKERITCLFHHANLQEEWDTQGIRGCRKDLSCSFACLGCDHILLHQLKEVAQVVFHCITGITPKFVLLTESWSLEFQLPKQTAVEQTAGATRWLWEQGQHHNLYRVSSRKDCRKHCCHLMVGFDLGFDPWPTAMWGLPGAWRREVGQSCAFQIGIFSDNRNQERNSSDPMKSYCLLGWVLLVNSDSPSDQDQENHPY